MQKFWAWLGLNLGKRAGVVSIVGLVITIVLGSGITQLEFATGQDSYLNKDEEVYKDSVAYQDLFGGQAMVTLVTLDEGQDAHRPVHPGGRRARGSRSRPRSRSRAATRSSPSSRPLTALQFTNALVLPDVRATSSEGVAAQLLLGATERDPTEEGKAARSASSVETLDARQRHPAPRTG